VLIPARILEGKTGRACPGNGVSGFRGLGLRQVCDPEGTWIA
jgi:hypothetical protein